MRPKAARSCGFSCAWRLPWAGRCWNFSSKFGTAPSNAGRLLKRIAGAGAKPGLTFHVGSQCLSPFTYAQAVELARRAADASGITVSALDVGGGFPGPYLGNDVPPFHWYFDTVREAVADFPLQPGADVFCEPGRALAAEGVSLIARVRFSDATSRFSSMTVSMAASTNCPYLLGRRIIRAGFTVLDRAAGCASAAAN